MKSNEPIKVGLRIDVDTYRGTRLGVPRLLSILDRHKIFGSFFFSVGPDNMGRHIWRLLRPSFMLKMLRSKAASLYGWDILLRGTIWPGPIIGHKLAPIIKRTDLEGHEVGLHAWDHHKWQMQVDRMSADALFEQISKGHKLLAQIIEKDITCSAVAGWRCNVMTLRQKERFNFLYNSDCRGYSVFVPHDCVTPQIPVTLPTYDEMIGKDNVNNENYNAVLLSKIKADVLNVYTIHAEVEGIVGAKQFEELLQMAQKHNIQFVPLSELLVEVTDKQGIDNKPIHGRDGWVSQQTSIETPN